MEMYRRDESAGSGGYGGGEQIPSVGEYQGDSGGNTSPTGGRPFKSGGYYHDRVRKTPTPRFPHGKGGHHGGEGTGVHGEGSREKILPPSQRYNFYRYYGTIRERFTTKINASVLVHFLLIMSLTFYRVYSSGRKPIVDILWGACEEI